MRRRARGAVPDTHRRRPVSPAGTTLLACGFVLVVVGGFSNANGPAGEANIGAGALLAGGGLVGLLGLVVWAVQGGVAQRRGARARRSGAQHEGR
jgi:hypothetical protein